MATSVPVGSHSTRPRRAAKTVLLVDDSAYWTETLAAGLRSEGYAVSVLHDGLAAIERLRRTPPDILITDYFLANLDGGKLCQLAKRLSQGAPITTIILTGGADRGLPRTPSGDADAVIAKNTTDIVFSDLRAVLHRVRRSQPPSVHPGEVIGHERLMPRVITSKLHGLKQHLDALHEGIGDAVIGVDRELRVYFLNSMALELFELDEDRALARPVAEALEIPDGHPLLSRIQEAIARGGRQERPLALECRDFSLRVTVSGIASPDGSATALIIARDISDLKAAEQARAQVEARLHEADKMASLGHLMASVSHEVNNPLAALMPNLNVVSNGFDQLAAHCRSGASPPAEVDGVLQELPTVLAESKEAVERIRAVVAQMLVFAGGQQEGGTSARLEDLLDSALSLIANEVRQRATIRRDYGQTPELVVDRTRVGQALLNVLLNAAQALEDGDPARDFIQVQTRCEQGGVLIEIQNSGPRIPSEVMPKIFHPFFTTKPIGKGVGLGLSITYDTLRRHGGYVDAQSDEQTPTTFRLWLPLDTGLALAPPPSTKPETPASVARILIVDDDKLVRNSLRRILERQHEVSVANNGQRALELMREQRFDVVLCDLIMPGMTGMELFEEVTRADPDQAARFVFLTGGTSVEAARTFLANVPNPRAYKPVSAEQITALVARCLENFVPAGVPSARA